MDTSEQHIEKEEEYNLKLKSLLEKIVAKAKTEKAISYDLCGIVREADEWLRSDNDR